VGPCPELKKEIAVAKHQRNRRNKRARKLAIQLYIETISKDVDNKSTKPPTPHSSSEFPPSFYSVVFLPNQPNRAIAGSFYFERRILRKSRVRSFPAAKADFRNTVFRVSPSFSGTYPMKPETFVLRPPEFDMNKLLTRIRNSRLGDIIPVYLLNLHYPYLILVEFIKRYLLLLSIQRNYLKPLEHI